MMMFITIIMLIVSLVSISKGGLHKGVVNALNKYYYVDENDKLVKKDSVSIENEAKFFVKFCLFLVLTLTLLVLQLIFFISALSVDVLVIPTVIMILLLVYRIVKGFVNKKKRTNKEIMENKTKGVFSRLVFLLYVIYIFVLIVV